MQQAVLKHFPDKQVAYKFTNRSKEMKFMRACVEMIEDRVAREFLHFDLFSCSSSWSVLLTDYFIPPFLLWNTEWPPYIEYADLADIYLQPSELETLKRTCPYFSETYLSYLTKYRFRPSEQVSIRLVPEEGGEQDVGQLEVEIRGLWAETILYEVPVMAIISEAYFNTVDTDWNSKGQEGELLLFH